MSTTLAATAVSIALVHGGFVDGSGWQGVYNIPKRADTVSASSRIPRSRSTTTSRRHETSNRGAARRVILWVTRMARSHHGGRNDPKVAGLVLHRRVCAGS